MPESIFKQVSLDILRLHQHTLRSLLATQGCGDCEIHDAVYMTLDGRYYLWLPRTPSEKPSCAGILLIEDESACIRLSWVADMRPVRRKDNLYRRVSTLLQRRMQRAKDKFHQAADACLLELTPQQGRLSTGGREIALSPCDLVKALYPASHRLAGFAQ
ncbi:hypothetical protein [Bergeriella denitrificans]|uniref:Putative lipoprotein n=1 Tax=Bergeriella denitrificans TaxID=494 RepID=A0A378UGX7_BERDE|nr:hypothetical protein [Bergeriella denitrificans]STZ76557.1 putative lipoprotein [Bergeriella denitrificans]